tara:strand:- start:29 stop:496 length:468 start_codon:yes stop_codon:yes gene_type:complete
VIKMTNKETKYAEKLMKFIIGEEVKVKRTKGEKVKLKELGVGHLSADKSQSVKLGEREYASGTISKIEKDSAWNFPPTEGRKGAWPLKPNPDKPKQEEIMSNAEKEKWLKKLRDELGDEKLVDLMNHLADWYNEGEDEEDYKPSLADKDYTQGYN